MTGSINKVLEDIRWKPIKDVNEVKTWLDRVKHHIITEAYRAGIRLPSTNTGIDETQQTYEDYTKAVAGDRPAE